MANNSEAATTLAAGGTNPAQPQGSTMCCDINALWDAAISGLKITMDMDGLLDKDKVALVKAYIMDDATFRLQLLAQAFNSKLGSVKHLDAYAATQVMLRTGDVGGIEPEAGGARLLAIHHHTAQMQVFEPLMRRVWAIMYRG